MSARRRSPWGRRGAAVPAGGVIAVVEPAGANDSQTGAAVTSQAVRLAAALDLAPALLSWSADEAPDIEWLATTIARVAQESECRVLLLADGDLGRQLAPMVAFDLGTSAVLGCSDVVVRDGEPVYVKPVCGGWLQREVSFAPGYLHVATVGPAAVPTGLATSPGSDELILVSDLAEPAGRDVAPPVTRLEVVPPDPRTVDIVHARRVVGAGAGSASVALLAAVGELAELLEGSVGATRPVVDDGRLPKERLIGQTGKSVAPELYLALGISGSPHHVAGVQGADRIIAVNKDDHARILSFADAGYIGDLETVLPGLVRRIKAWRDEAGGQDAREP